MHAKRRGKKGVEEGVVVSMPTCFKKRRRKYDSGGGRGDLSVLKGLEKRGRRQESVEVLTGVWKGGKKGVGRTFCPSFRNTPWVAEVR